jgi:sulfopyruvate decarboxylase TPP-binding subunit
MKHLLNAMQNSGVGALCLNILTYSITSMQQLGGLLLCSYDGTIIEE